MFNSPQDWIIVLVIALILFGPKKLPEIGRSVGQALKEFKKSTSEALQPAEKEAEPKAEDKTGD